jgi:hypothetical protein
MMVDHGLMAQIICFGAGAATRRDTIRCAKLFDVFVDSGPSADFSFVLFSPAGICMTD